MEKIIIGVEGMSCSHCELAVQDSVRKLPGIKKVKARRRRKQAEVEFDSSLTSREAIEDKIEETGFVVVP